MAIAVKGIAQKPQLHAAETCKIAQCGNLDPYAGNGQACDQLQNKPVNRLQRVAVV